MSNIAQELTRIQLAKEDIKNSLVDNGISVGNEHLTNYCLYVDDVKPNLDINEIIDSISDADPLTMIQIDNDGGYITIFESATNLTAKSFQWRKNNGEWTTYNKGDYIFAAFGDKIQWRSSDNVTFSFRQSSNYRSFVGGGKFILGGSIRSLLNNGTTIPQYCFSNIFKYFPVVETYVNISANTLSNYAFYSMYEQCVLLKKAKFKLEQTIKSQMCQRMFYNCVNLKEAPIEITTTSVANNCFNSMFYGCVSLTLPPPHLPATTLSTGCYQNMFYNCSSLKYPPYMEPTSLASNCCDSMFYGCRSLVETTVFSENSYTTTAYKNMFNGCSSLKRVYGFTAVSDDDEGLFTNACVSSGGLSYQTNIRLYAYDGCGFGLDNPTYTQVVIQRNMPTVVGAYHIDFKPIGGSCIVNVHQTGSSNTYKGYLFQENPGATAIFPPVWGDCTFDYNGEASVTIPSGKELWFTMGNAENITPNDTSNYITINIDATNCDYVEIDGDITSLIQLNRNTNLTPLTQYAFYKLFAGQDFSKIRFGEKLMHGLRYLATNCFESMFEGATNIPLTNLTLSAEIIPSYGYKNMFKGSNISSIPSMSAKTLDDSCFEGMFQGTNITSVKLHKFNEATNATLSYFYNMFRNCTSLTKLEIPKCSYSVQTPYTNICNGCSNLTNIIIKEPTYLGAIGLSSISSVGNIRAYSVNLTNLDLPNGWNKIEFD